MDTAQCANCGAVLTDAQDVCDVCDEALVAASPALAWGRFANEVGGEFVDAEFKVFASVDHWIIELETFEAIDRRSWGSSDIWTRMKAPFLSLDGFSFNVYRAGFFTGVGKLVGMQDIKIGFQGFDRDFVVKGTHEDKAKDFFSNPRIVELIGAQPSIQFCAKQPHAGSQGEAELRFQEEGIISDVERLHLLHELFAQSLRQLCRIGSASPESPAIASHTRSIELDPHDSEAYFGRALAFTLDGQFERAIDDLNQVVRLRPEDGDAYRNRGLAYAHLGDVRRAIGDFGKAIDVDPQDADAHYQRGVALAELRRVEEARADLEKAWRLTKDLDRIAEIDDLLDQLQRE